MSAIGSTATLDSNPFRDPTLVPALVASIERLADSALERHQPVGGKLRIMEVCGGHTISLLKYGLRSLLPETIDLISGPGCPVCVTPIGYIDHAIALSSIERVVVASFGDLLRVPGSERSLLQARAEGAELLACYSPLDALAYARNYPEAEVVFCGIGFETTAPTVGATLLRAAREGVANFSLLSAHRTMPEAMAALVLDDEVAINAFICPGHVSAITGSAMYQPIAEQLGTPCVISGFEPLDLLLSIERILAQLSVGESRVEIEYSRSVRCEGNPTAQQVLRDAFTPCDAEWRGLGTIQGSGLAITESLSEYDASKRFQVTLPPERESRGCICGDILRGVLRPTDCRLFARKCTPEHPVGACMVSDEGCCATWFQYGQGGESI